MVRGPRTQGLGGSSHRPQPPIFPPQEEERAAQATGEFEVFVDGKLVHSKKVILSKGSRQGRRALLASLGVGVRMRVRVGGWVGGGDKHVRALFPPCPER